MCKTILVNELVKNQQSSDYIITVVITQAYIIPVLIEKVTAIRDAARKRTKKLLLNVQKFLLSRVIPLTPLSHLYLKDVAQATNIAYMKKLHQKVDKNEINLFSIDNFFMASSSAIPKSVLWLSI